ADIAITQEYRCDASGSSATPQLGEITISNPLNGNGSYEYSIDGVDFTNTTGIFTGLTDGTYTLYIRDTDTAACPVNLGQLTIDPLQEVTDLSFASPAIQCPALTSAVTVTATGNNGASSFEYRISAPAGSATAFSAANTFTLPAGTYTFEARTTTDGCVYAEDFTIDTIDFIAVSGSVTAEPTCNGDTDGSLSFTVTDIDLTATTYSYVVTGGTIVGSITGGPINTTPTPITGLGAGTYTITVTDDTTNCTATDTVIITEPTVLGFTVVVDDADCGANTGIITVTATGGRGGYEYELRDAGNTPIITYQSSNVFTGLAAGTYIIAVRDGNSAAACSVDNQATPTVVGETLPPSIALAAGGDACYDTTNQASQWITITGGVGPYTYSLDGGAPVAVTFLASPPNPANTFEIPGLTPAIGYSVVVTDTNNCSSGAVTFDIQPELTLAASLTKDLDCSASPDAVIAVTTTGGNGGNTFEININAGGYGPYAGVFPFTTTTAGTYQFRVTDSEGCQAETGVITVTPAPDPVANAVATDATCFGQADGSVVITVDTTVGTAPYQIDFNGGGFSNQTTYGSLAAATYNYVVRDAKGCTDTFSIAVGEPADVVIGTESNVDITCSPGTGNVLGTIDLSNITGGTPPYTYSLLNPDNSLATTTSPNPVGPTPNDFIVFNDVDFGNYTVRIVDANGCLYEFDYSIATPAIFTITESSTASCAAGVTANITVTGGTGPFRIREYPSGAFVNLNALPASSGTPFERNHQFPNLPFDTPFTYEIIDDGTNCTDIRTLTPPANPSTINIALTENDVSCNAAGDGSIDYTITTYQGDELTYEVFRITDLSVDISGTLTFGNGNPETVPVGGSAIDNISGFGPGDYLLRVTETGGAVANPCNSAIQFTIEEPTPVNLIETSNTPGNCNTFAEVVVNGQGGTPPYRYAAVLDGAPAPLPGAYNASNVLLLDQALGLLWDVYMLDANDCPFGPLDVTITATADPVFTSVPAFVDDPCTFDNNYTFTVLATGDSQLEFGIDDGDTGTADTPIFVAGTPTGTPNEYTYTYTVTGPSVDQYTLTVRDVNGCTDTDQMIVFPELLVSADFTTEPTCRNFDGEITVTVTGGSDFTTNPGNFTFVLTGTDSGGAAVGPITQVGAGGNIFSTISAGSYSITVTDAAIGPAPGCDATTTVTREVPLDPVLIVIDTDNESCVAAGDGSIQVGLDPAFPLADDNPPYTYELYAGAVIAGVPITTQVDNGLFTGLAPGAYSIRVTSSLSCFDDELNIIIDPADPLGATPTLGTYSCNGSNAEDLPDITVDIVGGVAPYSITYTGPISGTNLPVTGTQFIILDTPAGSYDITITDDNNCTFTIPTQNVGPFPIMSNPVVTLVDRITCAAPNAELVTVSVDRITGNTNGFQFDLLPVGGADVQTVAEDPSGTTTSGNFSLPAVGTYIFRITDLDTGCSIDTAPYEVLPFDTIEATIALTANTIQCFGDNGEVSLSVTGHTGPYTYDATNLTTGVVVSGGGDNTVLDPIIIGGLGAGNIQVTVTDPVTTCDDVSNIVTLMQPTELMLSLVSQIEANCNDDGRVEVTASGGTAPYVFTATDGGTVFTNNDGNFTLPGATGAGIVYTITVTDANSCASNPASLTVTVITADNPVLDPLPAFVDDACTFDNSYTFTATATSNVTVPPGTGTLTFQLNADTPVSGNVSNTEHQFTVTAPGTYTVTVYDENGCPSNVESIIVYPEPIVSADFTTEPTCRNFDGEITVTVTGGSDFTTNPGNFTFVLTGTDSGGAAVGPITQVGAGGNIFSTISAGSYSITVTDAGIGPVPGCDATTTVTREVPLDPVLIVIDTDNESCVAAGDGSIQVGLDPAFPLADDNPPYTYELYAGAVIAGVPITTQVDNGLFTGLAPGAYSIRVTSSLSCFDDELNIIIDPADPLGATPTLGTYSCNGSNAEDLPDITVDIVGGVAPY
ncbi:hypothetical protein, partial [Aquimarina sp. 2201CG5-10]|uniref:hypothetical protein n=1 Tax=Aquimarina callyspongiae TaxID=3098150 RepID=UPI002AB447E0